MQSETRKVLIGEHTKQAYGQALESFLVDDRERQFYSLKQLFKSLHCDLTGELRDPHNAPGSKQY